MAAGSILRQRAIAPVAAGISAIYLLTPRSIVHAESAQDVVTIPNPKRKSFYDDQPQADSGNSPSNSNNNNIFDAPSQTRKPSATQPPTPTDRLAGQVARSRLALHAQAARLEDGFNNLATRAFRAEHNFTSTIASLAPSRQSGETVLPGAIYVLVAAMGSSIMVRNRNVLLRATLPVAVGIGAANYLLPVTSKNVGDLVWRYEKRWPALAEAHERTRERVELFLRTGWEHSKMGKDMLEDKIGGVRKNVEGWVSKGQ